MHAIQHICAVAVEGNDNQNDCKKYEKKTNVMIELMCAVFVCLCL